MRTLPDINTGPKTIEAQKLYGDICRVCVVFNHAADSEIDGFVRNVVFNAAEELNNGQKIQSKIEICLYQEAIFQGFSVEKDKYRASLVRELEATGLFEVQGPNNVYIMPKDGILTPDTILAVMDIVADTGGANPDKTRQVIDGTRMFNNRYMYFHF